MADSQDLVFSERGQVAGIVGEGAHVGGNSRDNGFVDEIVVVAAGGYGCEVWFVGQAVVIAIEQSRLICQIVVIAAKKVWFVDEVVVVAIETDGQFHKATVGQVQRVVADAQHLITRDSRSVVEVVVVAADGHGCQVGLVDEVVVVAIETDGQFHKATVGQVQRVIADAQYLVAWDGGFVGEVVVIAAGGHGGEVRNVGEVVVVAGEAVGGLLREQRVRHAHQLLRGGDAVVDSAFRVDFRQQEIGPAGPVDVVECARHDRAAANLHGHQAVGVGGHLVRFRIDYGAGGIALHDGDSCRDILVGNQGVGAVAHHCLVGHFLRGLGYHSKGGQNEDKE